MPKAKAKSGDGAPGLTPLCKRAKRVNYNSDLILRKAPPIDTLQKVEVAARQMMWRWPYLLKLEERAWKRIEPCLKTACTYAKLMLPQPGTGDEPSLDGQRCPLCLKAIGTLIQIWYLEALSTNVVRAAARLLPDAYKELEVIHLSDFPDVWSIPLHVYVENRKDAGGSTRDWNRLLKAATLARERQESHAGLTAPPAADARPPAAAPQDLSHTEKLARVLAFVKSNPDISEREVERKTGISTSTFRAWQEYRALRKMLAGNLPKGHKTKDGTVEAYD